MKAIVAFVMGSGDRGDDVRSGRDDYLGNWARQLRMTHYASIGNWDRTTGQDAAARDGEWEYLGVLQTVKTPSSAASDAALTHAQRGGPTRSWPLPSMASVASGATGLPGTTSPPSMLDFPTRRSDVLDSPRPQI